MVSLTLRFNPHSSEFNQGRGCTVFAQILVLGDISTASIIIIGRRCPFNGEGKGGWGGDRAESAVARG